MEWKSIDPLTFWENGSEFASRLAVGCQAVLLGMVS